MNKKIYRMQLRLCGGSTCLANHSFEVYQALEAELKKNGLEQEIELITTGTS